MKRMSIEIPNELEQLAAAEHRSVNSQAQVAFSEHLAHTKLSRPARRKNAGKYLRAGAGTTK